MHSLSSVARIQDKRSSQSSSQTSQPEPQVQIANFTHLFKPKQLTSTANFHPYDLTNCKPSCSPIACRYLVRLIQIQQLEWASKETQATSDERQQSHFLQLPPEIRCLIYDYYFEVPELEAHTERDRSSTTIAQLAEHKEKHDEPSSFAMGQHLDSSRSSSHVHSGLERQDQCLGGGSAASV